MHQLVQKFRVTKTGSVPLDTEEQGFTLAEVIVASALMVIIMLATIPIVNGSMHMTGVMQVKDSVNLNARFVENYFQYHPDAFVDYASESCESPKQVEGLNVSVSKVSCLVILGTADHYVLTGNSVGLKKPYTYTYDNVPVVINYG